MRERSPLSQRQKQAAHRLWELTRGRGKQRAFAKKCGIDEGYFSHIVHGNLPPSLDASLRIHAHLENLFGQREADRWLFLAGFTNERITQAAFLEVTLGGIGREATKALLNATPEQQREVASVLRAAMKPAPAPPQEKPAGKIDPRRFHEALTC